MRYQGLITAIITPFRSGAIDYDALGVLCRRAMLSSTALVALGTTAEPCSLSAEEKDEVVRYLLSQTAKPVVVGVSGNNTPDVVASARHWQQVGASALLVITPYYNKCTTEGLVAHFRAVCEAVDVPVILYNVPARTGVNVSPDTLQRLLLLPNVVGVKDAIEDAAQILSDAMVCRLLGRAYLCGEDAMLPLFRAVGAQGVVSAAAVAVPDVMAEGMHVPLADLPRWTERYLPLLRRLFAEVNPVGVKQACYHLGLCSPHLRLPLSASADPELPLLLERAGFAIVNH